VQEAEAVVRAGTLARQSDGMKESHPASGSSGMMTGKKTGCRECHPERQLSSNLGFKKDRSKD
jgi:hypothetical protein